MNNKWILINNKDLFKILLISLLVMIGVAFVTQTKAAAAPDCGVLAPASSGGNDCQNGQNYGTCTVEAAACGSTDSATLKANFINAMNGYLGGQSFQQIGANWIIGKMGGSGCDWTCVQGIINSSSVSLTTQNFSYALNTAYDPNSSSVIQYSDPGTYSSLVFTQNGAEVFAIKLNCGNPVGNLAPFSATNKPVSGLVYYTDSGGGSEALAGVPVALGTYSSTGCSVAGAIPVVTTGSSTTDGLDPAGGGYNFTTSSNDSFCIQIGNLAGFDFKAPDGTVYSGLKITPGSINGAVGSCAGISNYYTGQYTGTVGTYSGGGFGCTYVGAAPGSYNFMYTVKTPPNTIPTITGAPTCTNLNIRVFDPTNPADVATVTSVKAGGVSVAAPSSGTNYDISSFDGFSGPIFTITASDAAGSSTYTTSAMPVCGSLTCPAIPPGINTDKQLSFPINTTVNAIFGSNGSPPVIGSGTYTVSLSPAPPTTSTSYTVTQAAYTVGPTASSPPSASAVISDSASATINNQGNYNVSWTMTYPNVTSITCNDNFNGGGGGITVYTEPYIKVYGGDASAGVVFPHTTVTSTASGIYGFDINNGPNSYIGSNAHRGLFATALVNGFGSSNNLTANNPNAPPPDLLTFANSTAGHNGYLGKYYSMPDYYGLLSKGASPSFTVHNATPGQTLSSILGGIGTYTLPSGSRELILVKNQDFHIDENVSFTAPTASNLATYPMLYVVDEGGNIYIDSNVTNIAGVFIDQPTGTASNKASTNGNIFDCYSGHQVQTGTSPYDFSDSDPFNNCTNELQVNGTFMAGNVDFQRSNGNVATAPSNDGCGAGTPDANAADIFCYSPLTWLVNPFDSTAAPPTNYFSQVPPTL